MINNLTSLFQDKLFTVNTYFENGMQFYICKVSEINSSEFYTISASQTDATLLYNEINEPDMINVYLVHNIFGGAGYTSYPWNIYNQGVFLTHSISPEDIAHEFGHYFGLFHT